MDEPHSAARAPQSARPSPFDRIGTRFEMIVLTVVQLLLMVTIALSVVMFIWLFVSNGLAKLGSVESMSDLQPLVIQALAGALLVLLGLELLESLKTFFVQHHVRIELILIVATIAVGRHIILLDFAHAGGLSLVGIAALVLALTSGYYLVKRSPETTL